MLTAEKFAKLTVQEQVTTLLGQGNELLERIYVYNLVKLYHLDNFYAEIWYQQITNRITRVNIVDIGEVIHLYENQINISDLFK